MTRADILVLVASLVVVTAGCGEDDGAPDIDGASFPDGMEADRSIDRACNPVAQTGCLQSEKCTFQWDAIEPIDGVVVCADDGTVGAGDSCSIDEQSNIDDCEAGLLCYGGAVTRVCLAMCAAMPSDTCDFGTCTHSDGLLYDHEGVCLISSDLDAGT